MLLPSIVRKEVLENLISYRNGITVMLCLILLPASVFLMYYDYQNRQVNYSLGISKGLIRSDTSQPKVSRTPAQLSVLARGLADDTRRLIAFDRNVITRTGGSVVDTGRENPLFSLFIKPDFVYVVKIVMSLLVLFFAFDAVCGEKERGTLALSLSNPVSRGTILLGKWLGGYFSFLMAFAPGLILCLIILSLFPGVELHGEEWTRIGFIILVSLIYLSVFFNLGLFISTRTRQSSTALLIGLFMWLLLVPGVHSFSAVAARRVSPVPHPNRVIPQKEELSKQAYSAAAADVRKGADRQARYEAARKELFEGCARIDAELVRRTDYQTTLSQNLSRIFPSAVYVYATTTMAQTGIRDAQQYKNAVLRWEADWRIGRAYDFKHDEMSLSDSLNTIWLDLLLLVLFNILLLMAAYVSFLRYDAK